MSKIISVEIDWEDPLSGANNPTYHFKTFDEASDFIRLSLDNGHRVIIDCYTPKEPQNIKE